MPNLLHQLEREIAIQASREVVFRYFTDSTKWAAWWGAGSTIDARPGGRVYIRHPTGDEVEGEVLAVEEPERIVFTYGYVRGTPIRVGESRVTVQLEATHARGATRLRLVHGFEDAAVRDEHVQGWRYQLSLFGNLVADAQNAGASALVDDWFAAWAEPDVAARTRTLERIAQPDVQFRDRFSVIDGMAELVQHISGAQRFMPGIRLERTGAVRHCQGLVICDWTAKSGEQTRGSGMNVFELRADGRFGSVTGFWNAPS